jgi:hypothetical protein
MSTYHVATGARLTFAITARNPGAPVPDGDGSYTPGAPVVIAPAPFIGHIRPAALGDLERFNADTVLARQALVVLLPFHPDISTQTQLAWTDTAGRAHTANVTGLTNPDGRGFDLEVLATEIVP